MGWKTKEIAAAYYRAWWVKNGKAYSARNRENINAACKRYRAKPDHRAKVNPRQNAYFKRKYKTDPNFQVMRKIRPRIRKLLRNQGSTKYFKTCELIGCTPEFLRGYLEGQFRSGMTWENIHIDHHIPCSAFNLCDPEQQKQCFHYSNLRPLLAVDNLKKGKRIPHIAT